MTTPVVPITGGLTGIGRAAALAFARQHARVVVSGRRQEQGQALASELRALGAEAEFIQADVRREDEVRQLLPSPVACFCRLDVAVNNAGTEGKPGPATEQTAESYVATFDTNVLGVILSLKHEIRVMQAQGAGSIINISSTYGHKGAAGASIYAASKHAVEGLTRSVALGGRRCRSSCQCGSSRPDRYRDARPLHRQRGGEVLHEEPGSYEAPRQPRRGGGSHRIPRFKRLIVCHRPDSWC